MIAADHKGFTRGTPAESGSPLYGSRGLIENYGPRSSTLVGQLARHAARRRSGCM